MKKNELKNGDVVMLRSGSVAVVVDNGTEAYLMFQNSGYEFLNDYYNDDLISDVFDDAVMQVFRAENGIGFDVVDEEQPIWVRKENWNCTTTEGQDAKQFEIEDKGQIDEVHKTTGEQREQFIDVIAQQYYGNCTYTTIHKDNVDFFLHGIISPELFLGETLAVDRRVVKIPKFQNLAIVYDQIQEDKYVHEEYPELVAKMGEDYRQRWGKEIPMQISCNIPEIGLTIHTRCFACRIDENGNLQSLLPEDSTSVLMTLNQ